VASRLKTKDSNRRGKKHGSEIRIQLPLTGETGW
jgi:hypothetical protein